MTDNEIIKALECCTKTESLGDCEKLKCPMYTKNGCAYYLGVDEDHEHTICYEHFKNALDLINRQKAEIKSLKREAAILSENADSAFQDGLNEAQDLYASQIRGEARAEAIKEFAEAYKEQIKSCTGMFADDGFYVPLDAVLRIVEFCKEQMIGEQG